MRTSTFALASVLASVAVVSAAPHGNLVARAPGQIGSDIQTLEAAQKKVKADVVTENVDRTAFQADKVAIEKAALSGGDVNAAVTKAEADRTKLRAAKVQTAKDTAARNKDKENLRTALGRRRMLEVRDVNSEVATLEQDSRRVNHRQGVVNKDKATVASDDKAVAADEKALATAAQGKGKGTWAKIKSAVNTLNFAKKKDATDKGRLTRADNRLNRAKTKETKDINNARRDLTPLEARDNYLAAREQLLEARSILYETLDQLD